MKPFNLELAKVGHPVCTRNGHKARIVCFDRKSNNWPILALYCENSGIEIALTYSEDGQVYPPSESNLYLMMESEKKEGWVNIYRVDNSRFVTGGSIYKSKEEAIKGFTGTNLVDTVKIEWEE